jgi:hypothetical protein
MRGYLGLGYGSTSSEPKQTGIQGIYDASLDTGSVVEPRHRPLASPVGRLELIIMLASEGVSFASFSRRHHSHVLPRFRNLVSNPR